MISKIVGLISSIYFFSVGLPAILAVKPTISITRVDKGGSYNVFETENYKSFESDRAYVILVKEKSEEGPEVHNVLYWIGSKTPFEIARSAAVYASELHFKHASKADIIRETEGIETETFKALFEAGVDNLNNSVTSRQGTSETIDETETQMILIEEKFSGGSLRLKEIKFSSENIKRQDICFVAFNSKTVFLYCGNGAADKQNMVDLAVYVTKIISTKMGSQANIIKQIGPQSNAEFFDEFQRASDAVEIWKTSSDYKRKEIVSLEDNFSRNFTMAATYYYKTGKTIAATVGSQLSCLFPFNSENCYLFDSCLEDIGMLVWIGTNSDLEIQTNCVGSVESYYDKEECSMKRPVIFIKEENVHLPRGEQRLQVEIKDFINIMFRLNLSWTEVLKNEKMASSPEVVY